MENNRREPSGLLNVNSSRDKFQLCLHAPSPNLDFFVEHYWIVQWDLTGRDPYVSENLPHPCVHLVFQQGDTRIFGVNKQKFSILLRDKGCVFGIKFRPGAFYPFVNVPVNKFTGRSIPFRDIFGNENALLEETILSRDNENDMVDLAETFIRGRRPDRDGTVALIKEIVDGIMGDRTITKVEDVAARFDVNKRMLQRMFSKYVGVSPKWVIQRYRLLEVADQLAGGNPESWPQLAAELGYYDQSHFIKDFKSIVGRSPEDYMRRNASG